MVRQEKHAWFNLAVLVTAAAVFLILIPLVGVKPALGAVGLCGLWGLGPLFYRKKQDESVVVIDERDQFIQRRAVIIAHAVFWVLFVLTCMLLWWMNKDNGTISVEAFPMMAFGGFIIVTVVQSLATLIMYRTGS
ncbi:hypothetical protein ACFL7D_06740 [candidate division KSB1 bacterium]